MTLTKRRVQRSKHLPRRDGRALSIYYLALISVLLLIYTDMRGFFQ